METQFRTAYQKKPRQPTVIQGKTMTKQAHKAETDINQIMAKYIKTGILEHANNYSGQYGFATSDDFTASMQIVQDANDMFSELPAAVRKKFQNDPGQFLDFVQDPENEPQFYDMGLSNSPYEDPLEAAEILSASSHGSQTTGREDFQLDIETNGT